MDKERLTEQEKLEARRLHPAPALPFRAITLLSKALFKKKYGVTFEYSIDLKEYRGKPYVVVANHASRADYIYTGLAFWPDTFNYVVGYNEFFRGHLAALLRLLKVVPKKNFTPQPHAVKQMKRIISEGGRLIIMPEGMSSISGANQPCALGGGQLLKFLDVPVLYCKIKGGYLTNPKFCLDERPGAVDVTVDCLFTPDQLRSMTADQLQREMDVKLWHDDYEWNKRRRARYDGHGHMAKNLHQLLFWCPKCGAELSMEDSGDTIRCAACGNQAALNEYYDLIPRDDSCVIPETPRVWFDMQRAHVREQVRQPGYALTERVRLGVLPRYQLLKAEDTSVIVGEGELRLDSAGVHFSGVRDGESWSFDLPIHQVPTYGMCTDVSRFYTFVNGEFVEFYPQRESTELWFMATEEMHRFMGGPWKDFN